MRLSMKKVMILSPKRVALVASFLVCGFFASAQSPAWNTSKDVQRVANKEMFADEQLRNSHIDAVSVGYPYWALAKGVMAVSANQDMSLQLAKGNIASSGYPMWTVSKGVAAVSNSSAVRKSDNNNTPKKDPSSLTVSKGVNNIKKKK
jgi:hypothetical protein